MVLRSVELIFTIATVALVLTHANQFATAVGSLSHSYSTLVSGLQGR